MAAKHARAHLAPVRLPAKPAGATTPASAGIPSPPTKIRPSTGCVFAVARCRDCGLELGEAQVSQWERATLPTNPWAHLVALADVHALACRPPTELPPEMSAARLRVIEAWARRCTRDAGGLMALGDAVRKLLAPVVP